MLNINSFFGIGDWGLGIGDWGLKYFDIFFVLLAGLVVEDYHFSSPTFGVINLKIMYFYIFILNKNVLYILKVFIFRAKKFQKVRRLMS